MTTVSLSPEKRNIRIYLFAAFVVAVGIILAYYLWGLLGLFSFFLISLYLFAGTIAGKFVKDVPEREKRNVWCLFLIALAIRVVCAIAVYMLHPTAVTKDETIYLRSGLYIADILAAGRIPDLYMISQGGFHYGYSLLVAFHDLLYSSRLLSMFTNCFLNAFTIYFLHRLTVIYFPGEKNEKLRHVTCFIYALFPFAIYLSASNLKEATVTFIVMAILVQLSELARKVTAVRLAQLLLLLFVLRTFRFYLLFIIVAVIFAMMLMIYNRKGPDVLLKRIFAIACVIAVLMVVPAFRDLFTHNLQRSISQEVLGRFVLTALVKGAPVGVVGGTIGSSTLLSSLAGGLTRFFFSPIPGTAYLNDGVRATLEFDALASYFLLPFFLYGFFGFIKRNFRNGLPVYAFMLGFLILESIVFFGIGRRNMPVEVLFVFFAAYGLVGRKEFYPYAAMFHFLIVCFLFNFHCGLKLTITLIGPLFVILFLFIVWLAFFAHLPGYKWRFQKKQATSGSVMK